jgi:hypothetical protein
MLEILSTEHGMQLIFQGKKQKKNRLQFPLASEPHTHLSLLEWHSWVYNSIPSTLAPSLANL